MKTELENLLKSLDAANITPEMEAAADALTEAGGKAPDWYPLTVTITMPREAAYAVSYEISCGLKRKYMNPGKRQALRTVYRDLRQEANGVKGPRVGLAGSSESVKAVAEAAGATIVRDYPWWEIKTPEGTTMAQRSWTANEAAMRFCDSRGLSY